MLIYDGDPIRGEGNDIGVAGLPQHPKRTQLLGKGARAWTLYNRLILRERGDGGSLRKGIVGNGIRRGKWVPVRRSGKRPFRCLDQRLKRGKAPDHRRMFV